jgi:hypothetical protein
VRRHPLFVDHNAARAIHLLPTTREPTKSRDGRLLTELHRCREAIATEQTSVANRKRIESSGEPWDEARRW